MSSVRNVTLGMAATKKKKGISIKKLHPRQKGEKKTLEVHTHKY